MKTYKKLIKNNKRLKNALMYFKPTSINISATDPGKITEAINQWSILVEEIKKMEIYIPKANGKYDRVCGECGVEMIDCDIPTANICYHCAH